MIDRPNSKTITTNTWGGALKKYQLKMGKILHCYEKKYFIIICKDTKTVLSEMHSTCALFSGPVFSKMNLTIQKYIEIKQIKTNNKKGIQMNEICFKF